MTNHVAASTEIHFQSSPLETANFKLDNAAAHQQVKKIVEGSGSSFYWAMRLLPEERRKATFAVYAFCREVDDIVDENGIDHEKRAALDQWRLSISKLFSNSGNEITALDKNMAATLHVLSHATQAYDLQEADFHAVIDGMEMDARGPVTLQTMDSLDLYCDRVASAVGRLCVHIFGQADANGRDVANHLGRALQLTNIIRDVPEDAEIDRLYLPQDLLATYGLDNQSPVYVAAHPDLHKICEVLGQQAERQFSKAKAAIASCDQKAMRAPIVMMNVYYQNLKRLRQADWNPQTLRNQGRIAQVRRKVEKFAIGLRHGIF